MSLEVRPGLSRRRVTAKCPSNEGFYAEVAAQLVGLVHRLTWCAIQRRVWLREARRTGRGLVVSRPCTDPFKSREECCKYSEYQSGSEQHEGGGVAIPFVGHKGELHSVEQLKRFSVQYAMCR